MNSSIVGLWGLGKVTVHIYMHYIVEGGGGGEIGVAVEGHVGEGYYQV